MTIDKRKYSLNTEMSIELQQKYSYLLKEKHCYENVKNLFIQSYVFNEHPNWKIALGIVYSGIEFVYVKHAFLVNENREIIEVKIPYSKQADILYYIAMEFNIEQYSKSLIKSKSYDLQNLDYIKSKWNDFEKWGRQNNILII